jgi:hypothetical protein
MSDDVTALQAHIATLEREIDQATFRAHILQAQLGGWEAACAAQVQSAQIYLDALSDTAHTGPQIAARARLANAIDSNAGELLLKRLQQTEAGRDEAYAALHALEQRYGDVAAKWHACAKELQAAQAVVTAGTACHDGASVATRRTGMIALGRALDDYAATAAAIARSGEETDG